MGGSIKVSVRFSQDHVESQVRWTNALPWLFRGKDFILDPAKHLRAYLDKDTSWREDDENVVLPVSYGLVVIDMVTQTVAHSNGYSSWNSEIALFDDEIEPDDRAMYEWFIEQKRLKLRTHERFEKKSPSTTTVSLVTSLEEVRSISTAHFRSRDRNYIDYLDYDLSPWKFVRFPEGYEGTLELKAWLIKNGFKLDDAKWAEWEAQEKPIEKNKRWLYDKG